MKKMLKIILSFITFLFVTIIIATFILLSPKRLKDKLPELEIVNIEYVIDDFGSISKTSIEKEKIEIFKEYLHDLKYVKRYNFLGYKHTWYDTTYFNIYYEDNYLFVLKPHYYSLYHNDVCIESNMLDKLVSSDSFDLMCDLF